MRYRSMCDSNDPFSIVGMHSQLLDMMTCGGV